MSTRDLVCYKRGKEGYFGRGCTAKTPNDNWHNRNVGAQLRSLQALTEWSNDEQDRKNVPKSNVRIYAYTKGDAEVRGSKVVTDRLPIVNKLALCCLIVELLILLYLPYLLIVWAEIKIISDKVLGRPYRLVIFFFKLLVMCCASGYIIKEVKCWSSHLGHDWLKCYTVDGFRQK